MHFCVCVIHEDGKSIEDVMRPFDENLKVEKCVEDGEEYWYNPNGKWDWYQVGGRWAGALKLKDSITRTDDMYGEPSLLLDKTQDPYNHISGQRYVDSALIDDIDMSLDMRAWNEALEDWDEAMKGGTVGFFETDKTLLRDYIIKENYAATRALFYFTYVIDQNGEWHQLWKDNSWCCNIYDRIKWAQDFIDNFIYPVKYTKIKYRITIVDMHD